MAKVFVIDDSVSVCVAVERMLSERGHDVVWEKDPATSLSTVERYQPDLVICDLVLPEISGFELCDSLASNPLLRHVPVLLISGQTDDETRGQVLASPALGLLVKPFSAEQLVGAVERILNEATPWGSDPTHERGAAALRNRLTHELQAFSSFGDRCAFIVDRDQTIIAANKDAEESDFAGPSDDPIRRLASSAMDAASARMTVETASGIQIVERLGINHQLVVVLVNGKALGKVRFVLHRVRHQLEALLAS